MREVIKSEWKVRVKLEIGRRQTAVIFPFILLMKNDQLQNVTNKNLLMIFVRILANLSNYGP